MGMSELAEVITGEFEEALDVKNPASLKRGIYLLLSSTVPKEEHTLEHTDLKTSIATLSSSVQLIASRMEEGFKRMDARFETIHQRFEAVDQHFQSVDQRFESMQQQIERRFTAVDKRFDRLTVLMSIGFLAITTLITVYRFLN
jgi:flagellar capping protein FliD